MKLQAMRLLSVFFLVLLMSACAVISLNDLDGHLTLETEGGATINDNSMETITIKAGDGHSLDAPDGDPVDVLIVNSDGNVGIGTEAPSEKLTVSGTVESSSGGFKFPDQTVQTTAASVLSGIEVIERCECDGSGAQNDFPVTCPPGKMALTGGAYISWSGCGTPQAFVGDVYIYKSYPIGDPPYGWRVGAAEAPGAPTGIHWKLCVQVVCIDKP